MRKPDTAVWIAWLRSGAGGMLRVLVSGLLASAWVSTGCMEIGIPVPACGDGMRDRSAGEQCDRGGDSATCDRDCTLPACGDGLFNPLANEQCDEGGDDSATCDGDCTLPVCGDGHVNAAADEACDDGIESAACDRDCSMPACGDGIENTLAGETCDGGDLDETDACTTRCQRAQCGDGFTHGGMEACDDGNTDDTDECMPWCAAASCLDGLRNGGETDLDCGGGCDVACGAGQRCASEGDCASGRCSGGQCVADRLDAGNWHTCALLESGVVRCWGRNRYGQLGYGHTSPIGDSEAPSSAGDVSAGERVVQLAAGAYHTCALLESGTVRCWGDNEYGRLGYGHSSPIGDNEAPSSVNPVDVGGRVVQLAAGDSHTCALLEGGAVRCWGPNWNGELGYGHMRAIGDDESPSSAGDVNVGGRVVQLAAGSYHTCAVLEGGGVRCWGYNENGQLGYGHMRAIGDDESPSSAGDVNAGDRVVQLAAGGGHTCALLDGGEVRCWGGNWDGQLGHGHTDHIGDDELPSSAGDVHVSGRAVQLATGAAHTCVLLEGGAVRCWGANEDGQLGHGHESIIGDDEIPDSVAVLAVGGRAVEISAGSWHTCALLEDGALRCWGDNEDGQLGYGHTLDIGDTELPASVEPVSYR